MSIGNWSRTEVVLSIGGFVMAILLIAWQPFTGNVRVPASLLALLGIFWLFRDPGLRAARAVRRLALVLGLLLLAVGLSLPGSFAPEATASLLLALVASMFMGIALLRILQDPQRLGQLQFWLLVIVVFWTFDALVQAVMGQDLFGLPLIENRVVGPFDDRFRIGLFLSVLLPVVLWSRMRSHPFASVLLVLGVGAVVVLSGNRSALLLYILASAVLLPRLAPVFRLVLVAGGMAVIVVISLQQAHLTERFQNMARLAFAPLGMDAASLDVATSGRSIIWSTGWEMFKDRPWTGVGAKAFAEAYDTYSLDPDDRFRSTGHEPVHHAHSMYVALAAETGLIGLLAVAVIAWRIAVWWRQAQGQTVARQRAGPYLASLFVVAFPLQAQPELSHLYWFPVIVLLLAAYLAALDAESSPASKPGATAAGPASSAS